MIKAERIPFLFLAMAALATGLISGLQRIGWSISFVTTPHHGAIMTGAFLGTLIILEKIIPLKNNWLFLVPAISGASAVLFHFEIPLVAYSLLIIASALLCLVFLVYLLRERSMIYVLMFVAALCWFIGNIILADTNFYPSALPWWMAFALLVISSERLELMKFLPVNRNKKLIFYIFVCLFLMGCAISFHGNGRYVAAVALIGVAVWLMRFDLIGITLHKKGLTRYVAIALLTGYASLLTTGIFLIVFHSAPLGYDMITHTFFIGFVFAMILAHGPIIFPGVIGIAAKPYHAVFYVWLILLHASWLTRVFADAGLYMDIRRWSGLMSSAAIIGYIITLVVLMAREKMNGKIS